MGSNSDWLEGLREFVRVQRSTRPLRRAAASPAAEAAERSIIGASLATRLADVTALREARRTIRGAMTDPAIVVTTSVAGIAAVTELLATVGDLAALADGRLEAVTELEYRLWCIRTPDEDFIHHVNIWNWVKMSVPRQRHAEFAAAPLGAGEEYWLHREGCAGSAGHDHRSCHLWKWNGRHAAMLRPFIAERSVRPLGDRAEEG